MTRQYDLDRTAEDCTWYFQEAESEAAGMRAVSISVLEEVQDNGGGAMAVKSGGRKWVDPYPDDERHERSRRKLRRVYQAMQCLDLQDRTVLHARFGTSAQRWVSRGGAPGLGELGWVATLAEPVQDLARSRGETHIEAVAALALQDVDSLKTLARAMVDGALTRLAGHLHPSFSLRGAA